MIVLTFGKNWTPLAESLAALEQTGEFEFRRPTWPTISDATEKLGAEVVLCSPDACTDPIPSELIEFASREEHAPVLLTTADPTVEMSSTYLLADEVIVLPCTPEELRLRLNRLTAKRISTARATLRVGKLALDLLKYEAIVAGNRIPLRLSEFKLLRFLMRNPGKIFTRDEIISALWPESDVPRKRRVDVHVSRLRVKLGSYGRYLRTVNNVGYGLMEPV